MASAAPSTTTPIATPMSAQPHAGMPSDSTVSSV